MTKMMKVGGFAALAMLALSTAALAEETSTTNVQTAAPSLTDKLVLNYWGNWRGPSVGSPNEFTPLATGDKPSDAAHDDMLWMENVITAGYKFTDTRSANFHFAFRNTYVKGGEAALLNSYASIRDKKLFTTFGANHDVALRLYVPTSESASTGSAAGMIVGPAIVDSITYDVGQFTFASWNRARAYVATGAGSMLWTLDIAPNANWQFSKTVAATLWIDLVQLAQKRGGSVENAYVDIEPGINWDITPNISVNPYLNIYPNSLTANATTINMIVTAKAF